MLALSFRHRSDGPPFAGALSPRKERAPNGNLEVGIMSQRGLTRLTLPSVPPQCRSQLDSGHPQPKSHNSCKETDPFRKSSVWWGAVLGVIGRICEASCACQHLQNTQLEGNNRNTCNWNQLKLWKLKEQTEKVQRVCRATSIVSASWIFRLSVQIAKDSMFFGCCKNVAAKCSSVLPAPDKVPVPYHRLGHNLPNLLSYQLKPKGLFELRESTKILPATCRIFQVFFKQPRIKKSIRFITPRSEVFEPYQIQGSQPNTLVLYKVAAQWFPENARNPYRGT